MVRQSNKQSEEHKSNDASTMTELATSLKEVRFFFIVPLNFLFHSFKPKKQNKFPQKTVSVSEKKDMKNTKKLEGAELIAELRRVVEEAFERDNLSNNHLLVSKMNAQMYVPISVVMEMESVRELSVSDEDLLKKAIEGSKTCVVNESGDMIKPSFKVERNTIILRDVPVDTTEKDVRFLFFILLSLSLSLSVLKERIHTLVKVDGEKLLLEALSLTPSNCYECGISTRNSPFE